jgi:hypothetical protein
MLSLLENLMAHLMPVWARHRREQALLVPLDDVIRADEDELLR